MYVMALLVWGSNDNLTGINVREWVMEPGQGFWVCDLVAGAGLEPATSWL
jgi:hypothetical protein